MKTRNAFVKLTICLLLALTTTFLVNIHQVSAQPITDCSKLVTGTYITTTKSDEFGLFRGILTFTQDGNIVSVSSNQAAPSPLDQSGVPSVQPFGTTQGSWKCTSDTKITATTFTFWYPTATLPGLIARNDVRMTFDPKNGIVQGTSTLRSFSLNANPLNDQAPVGGTFSFTGQRVILGQ
ncbi:hypothetical protein [uncultured Nostoc sp.]|uniref:hypothetical protein n=1 Tax=uncultured Nostoc sp. TaxID=340711 RepID=UPI002633410F|nr:hypothetical protein [uncultured Nostoc sp.]